MKKHIILLFAVVAAMLVASCTVQEGTLPGNDIFPHAVITLSTAELPYDPDVDVVVRITVNDITDEVYYFAEKTSDKDARGLSDDAYADFVIQNGAKVSVTSSEFDGSQVAGFVAQNLKFENTLSVVAVSGTMKALAQKIFTGIPWDNIATGTYTFANSRIANAAGGKSKGGVILQQRLDDPNYYRFKDVYAPGKHLIVVTYPEWTGEDDLGKYIFVRVPAQSTGLSDATYGAMSVRDMGYRYNDDSYIFGGGYEGCMYDGYVFYPCISVYVSAGNFGASYDKFIPD